MSPGHGDALQHGPFQDDGTLAEWLGTGLQNRLQQFDSARYLSMLFSPAFPVIEKAGFFVQEP